MSSFGSFLKQMLYERDILQKQLAVDLKIHRNTLSRWINGTRRPDLAWVQDIADRLGLEPRQRRELYHAAGYVLDTAEVDQAIELGAHAAVTADLATIQDTLHDIRSEELDTIKGIVADIRATMDDGAQLRATLDEIEAQRRVAICNLSHTQRQVLAAIPTQPTAVTRVLEQIRAQVPTLRTIRDKELHFRLHELRYVGLIRRQKDATHGWYYWVDTTQIPLLDESASVQHGGSGGD